MNTPVLNGGAAGYPTSIKVIPKAIAPEEEEEEEEDERKYARKVTP